MFTVSRRVLLALAFLLLLGVAYVPVHRARAAALSVPTVSVSWFDSTALVRWTSVTGATGYRVSLIRLSDMGIMEQKVVPSSQLTFDAQGIWPNQQYAVAVEALDSTGTLGAATLSAPGQASPISRATYNGFLDSENRAAGTIDPALWDFRLGQDNGPNQGVAFVNGQLHFHLETGNSDGTQTFATLRSRVPFDMSNGRTLHLHGEVDLKGDLHNWFGVALTRYAIGGDQFADLIDRPVSARATPMLELFDDQDGLHLFEMLPSGGVEIGNPYTGGYHTNNVRDELLASISTTHATISVDGVTAFDVTLPTALPFTSGYLHLFAEDYPGNGGGVTPPSACDAVMADCNVWHLDNWGFDAPSGTQQPATALYTPSGCAPANMSETKRVTFNDCGRLDNTGGYGFLSEAGQTASTTITLPSTFSASQVASALLSFDTEHLESATRLSVSVNGSPFTPLGYVDTRTNSWQSYGVPVLVSALHAGSNTITFRDSVVGAWDTPQVANIQLEVRSSVNAYAAPMLPPEPSPIGTWGGGSPTPSPSPSPTPIPPTPSPTPSPITINNVACTVTLNGSQQSGTCSGTFTPSK